MERSDTTDVVGDNDLTVTGDEGVDYHWVEDAVCFPESALALAGSGRAFASTAEAAVSTSGSLSVTALVGLVSLANGPQTVLAQRGGFFPAMQLQVTPDARWRFTVTSRNPSSSVGTVETAPGSAQVGVWTHLAGVLDRTSGEVILYVNGEVAAVGDAGGRSWPASGPFYVGVVDARNGTGSQPFHGLIDLITVWSSALHPDRIRAEARIAGLPIDNC